jgi:hypothetical protein
VEEGAFQVMVTLGVAAELLTVATTFVTALGLAATTTADVAVEAADEPKGLVAITLKA